MRVMNMSYFQEDISETTANQTAPCHHCKPAVWRNIMAMVSNGQLNAQLSGAHRQLHQQ